MDYPLFTKLAAEFFGTAILMIFGNGAVANAELKNTKGYHAGWLNIAMGYGFGVMFPVLMFGSVSGAHINPAMTIAQAVNGLFPWSDVLPYIVAQLLGALLGQLWLAPLLSAGEGVTILSCLLGGTIGFLLVRYFSDRLEQGEYGPRMLGVVLNTRHLS